MKRKANDLCSRFTESYRSFKIDEVVKSEDLKHEIEKYEQYLKELIEYYNYFDKECQLTREDNLTLLQFRDRLFSFIQICQNLAIKPLINKYQNIQSIKSIKLGRNSIYAGIFSIILGIGSVIYSNYLTKDSLSKNDLTDNSQKIISAYSKNIEILERKIDSIICFNNSSKEAIIGILNNLKSQPNDLLNLKEEISELKREVRKFNKYNLPSDKKGAN